MSSHGHSGAELTRLPLSARISKQNGNCNARSLLRAGRIFATLDSFRLLTESRDSKSSGQSRSFVQNQPRSNLAFLVCVAHDDWLRGTEFHYPERPENLPALKPLENWSKSDLRDLR
ncbi:hypothetical protein [Bradyrhizobium sp. 195]|uniref:hypothetical protein n=1 Tax=Bradyrhizobium sp. 195 TaxID=2782662 RepID=UPI002000BD03|nr:hypothetical protein [Bradyrhizobium sp. 195]UPK28065.1 hypothetical protein IVB26_05665 [Bradyrhizobium sp. 195]